MFDLDAPSPADRHSVPRSLVLRERDGTPLGNADAPVTLDVVGIYSPIFQDASRAQIQRLAMEMRSAADDETPAERLAKRDGGLELLVPCVVGWRSVMRSGQPAPCSPDNVRALLKGMPFARNQVEAFIHDDDNFPSLPAAPSEN
jgi:hypothetical protein